MCALALLAAATARPPGNPEPWTIPDPDTSTGTTGQPEHWRDAAKLPAGADEKPPRDIGLIRVTMPEARRLFTRLAPPAHRADQTFRHTWSIWRRCH